MAENINPAQLQKYLGGLDYPVDKDQLISHAQARGAQDEELDALRRLPMQRFNNANEVSQAFTNM